jgi:hypothetical protein
MTSTGVVTPHREQRRVVGKVQIDTTLSGAFFNPIKARQERR